MGAGLAAKLHHSCAVEDLRHSDLDQEVTIDGLVFDPEAMGWAADASEGGPGGCASRSGAKWQRCQCWLDEFEEAYVQLHAQRSVEKIDAALPLSSIQMIPLPAKDASIGIAPGPLAFGLADVVDRQFPFLYDVAAFLAGSPRELAHFFNLAASLDDMRGGAIMNEMWEKMFASRWPAFHEALRFKGPKEQSWCANMHDMLSGESRCEVLLEVFDRQKKAGYAMAAMCARVTYSAKEDHYLVKYFSLAGTPLEAIPSHEGHRLRFCPAAVREQLQPHQPVGAGCYPFRMLKGGTRDLVVGQGVEVLWKMQAHGPYGWWYGELESIVYDGDGTERATASITFAHFPVDSRWYRMQVRVGGGEPEPCDFGGFIGGIRGVTEAERRHWMSYFPKEPLVF